MNVAINLWIVTHCVPGCELKSAFDTKTYSLGQIYAFARARQTHVCALGSATYDVIELNAIGAAEPSPICEPIPDPSIE